VTEQQTFDGSGDPTLRRVADASLFLMAGAVARPKMSALQRQVRDAGTDYPWETVVDGVLAEPVDPQKLVQQGLRAQRDWILRGGRETPGPSLKSRGKGCVAAMIARALFFVLYTVAVVLLLLAVRHKWPDLDVYRLLEWLYGVFPSIRPA